MPKLKDNMPTNKLAYYLKVFTQAGAPAKLHIFLQVSLTKYPYHNNNFSKLAQSEHQFRDVEKF